MKGFGFLLQLCLLTFGLTAHALTLDSSAASADTIYQRITGEAEAHPDAIPDRPVTLKRAGFPQAKTKIAESGPYEKEEEEEVRTNGTTFKIITTSGSGTSAFFSATASGQPETDVATTPNSFRQSDAGPARQRHILFQVFRI